LILKAYTYFAARVAEGWDGAGGGEPGFRWAARRSRTLTDHVSLVTVISTDEEHAASIFETLMIEVLAFQPENYYEVGFCITLLHRTGMRSSNVGRMCSIGAGTHEGARE